MLISLFDLNCFKNCHVLRLLSYKIITEMDSTENIISLVQ